MTDNETQLVGTFKLEGSVESIHVKSEGGSEKEEVLLTLTVRVSSSDVDNVKKALEVAKHSYEMDATIRPRLDALLKIYQRARVTVLSELWEAGLEGINWNEE